MSRPYPDAKRVVRLQYRIHRGVVAPGIDPTGKPHFQPFDCCLSCLENLETNGYDEKTVVPLMSAVAKGMRIVQ